MPDLPCANCRAVCIRVGTLVLFHLRGPRRRASAQHDPHHRLSARLLHGRAGLADRLRHLAVLVRVEAERDRRGLRRRGSRIGRGTPSWQTLHTAEVGVLSPTSTRPTASTPAALPPSSFSSPTSNRWVCQKIGRGLGRERECKSV